MYACMQVCKHVPMCMYVDVCPFMSMYSTLETCSDNDG